MPITPKPTTRTIRLCDGGQDCPTVEFSVHQVVIRDDFAGEVRLTASQWAKLVAEVRSGKLA